MLFLRASSGYAAATLFLSLRRSSCCAWTVKGRTNIPMAINNTTTSANLRRGNVFTTFSQYQRSAGIADLTTVVNRVMERDQGLQSTKVTGAPGKLPLVIG